VSLEPVQPSGWPRAMAPPLTFDARRIEAEFVDDGQRLRGKGLVEFDEADVGEGGNRRCGEPCEWRQRGPCPSPSGRQPVAA